jgi:hypothetical protein
MIVHAYTHCYNNAAMLEQWLRHYSKFTEKMFIFDADSTDNIVDLVAQYPNAILKNVKLNTINEQTITNLMNTMYQIHSKAVDWVIVTEPNEFIFHKDLLKRLRRHQQLGATIIKPTQYEMVSDVTPPIDKMIYNVYKEGVCFALDSKPIIFSSTLRINLSSDRKLCTPDPAAQGRIADGEILNLHYGMTDNNNKNFEELIKKAVPVKQLGGKK